MNNFNVKALGVTFALAFSASAMAQNVTKSEYKAGKDRVSAEYKTAETACASLSGNAKYFCVADAKGKDKVALADLEASYKPTEKNYYEVRAAKAEADYGVAKEDCDDLRGTSKDVCVKEAKAAEEAAKADAKAQMKITDAKATANDKTTEARKDAKVDKVDAEFTVAKEKCDALAGGAKESCLVQVKTRFGKS